MVSGSFLSSCCSVKLSLLLTAGAANALYTLAGVMLTVATPSLRGALRALTWTLWIAGGSLTLFALAGRPPGLAIASGVLFVVLSPWAMWLGRELRARGSV